MAGHLFDTVQIEVAEHQAIQLTYLAFNCFVALVGDLVELSVNLRSPAAFLLKTDTAVFGLIQLRAPMLSRPLGLPAHIWSIVALDVSRAGKAKHRGSRARYLPGRRKNGT